jgi:hypothetical protein
MCDSITELKCDFDKLSDHDQEFVSKYGLKWVKRGILSEETKLFKNCDCNVRGNIIFCKTYVRHGRAILNQLQAELQSEIDDGNLSPVMFGIKTGSHSFNIWLETEMLPQKAYFSSWSSHSD